MITSAKPVHIIAEGGTNHGGHLALASKLAGIARESGADSVKFQLIYPEGLYLPKLWENGKLVENSVFAARAAQCMTDDDWRRLADHCRELALPMSASVFDERSLAFMDLLDPPYIKIASVDLNHSRLLKKAAETGRRLIVSTGMSTLGEIEQAVTDILSTGHTDLVLMHCVSRYPCPTDQTNVSFVTTLRSAFGTEVGFSDHTENSCAAMAALALGATWIEKHITYDRAASGFDHAYAMEPEMFRGYVADVRAVSASLAPKAAKLTPEEQQTAKRARRSLYAARDLPAGHVVTDQDVMIVRPAGPMAPNTVQLVVGVRLARDLKQFEPFVHEALAA